LAIGPHTTGAQVLQIFADNPGLYALPVINGTRVEGIIIKEAFYASLGTKYGFTLYHNRPVTLLMNSHPLVVTHDMSIEAVSRIAMTRGDEHLYDSIIVTEEGVYCGIVTIKDLLEKTTELKVNYAKHLNPLSGLPGNIIIEKQLTQYVYGDAPFTVVYIDIDNFKVYNDIYGFENGDRMLMAMVHIIESCTAQHCNGRCFNGHIGGDDFVIGIDGYDAAPLCEAMIGMFRQRLADFYTLDDLDKGYVTASNRHGQRERFGLVTLSIACVSNKDRRFADIFALSEHATMIKKRCKEVWDNHYVID
jgi:diguanylate cyclase (GGDEF)-like protein